MTVTDSLKIEINGTLDLHHFNPKDTRDLVSEFIFACHANKIYLGKIIHGKELEQSERLFIQDSNPLGW